VSGDSFQDLTAEAAEFLAEAAEFLAEGAEFPAEAAEFLAEAAEKDFLRAALRYSSALLCG